MGKMGIGGRPAFRPPLSAFGAGSVGVLAMGHGHAVFRIDPLHDVIVLEEFGMQHLVVNGDEFVLAVGGHGNQA